MNIDFSKVLESKSFYRFTGPPEHWLTAVKFMTWGLEEHLRSRWEKLQPGDVFFIHSTGTGQSSFKNAKSGIIGLGVISPEFSIKKNLLWQYEIEHNINKWPLLVPLSEVYLFSNLPEVNTWESPSPSNTTKTALLIDSLLKNAIALSSVRGFPQMGSFSAVSSDVAHQILFDKKPLYLFSSGERNPSIVTTEVPKESKLEKVTNSMESLRYTDTLQAFENIKSRVVRESTTEYTRDNELLAKAETTHATILQQLIDMFRKNGYDTFSSQHVDLFAHNEEKGFLLDVKSTENNNFRTQARKGIAQLFEYEYFEIQQFINEKNLKFSERYKLIVPSQEPNDVRYVNFINSLNIGVGMIKEERLNAVGEDFGFTKI